MPLGETRCIRMTIGHLQCRWASAVCLSYHFYKIHWRLTSKTRPSCETCFFNIFLTKMIYWEKNLKVSGSSKQSTSSDQGNRRGIKARARWLIVYTWRCGKSTIWRHGSTMWRYVHICTVHTPAAHFKWVDVDVWKIHIRDLRLITTIMLWKLTYISLCQKNS